MDKVYASSSLSAAFTIQCRVVGALIMRELHTRFGRHNVGFLWVIFEPMTLAAGITVAHVFGFLVQMPYGVDPAPFWIASYTPWVMFRSIIMRANMAIESNRTLLYHRIVTPLDIHIARAVLDFCSVTFTFFLLLAMCAATGLGKVPDRPLYILLGLFTLWLLAFGFALLYSAWAERSHLAEKIVEPSLYLALPVSGVFFMANWIPEPYRTEMFWVPMPNILEFIREGVFGGLNTPQVNMYYALAWGLGATVVGLLALRAMSKNVRLT